MGDTAEHRLTTRSAIHEMPSWVKSATGQPVPAGDAEPALPSKPGRLSQATETADGTRRCPDACHPAGTGCLGFTRRSSSRFRRRRLTRSEVGGPRSDPLPTGSSGTARERHSRPTSPARGSRFHHATRRSSERWGARGPRPGASTSRRSRRMNRSKTRSRSAGAIPGPVSDTVSVAEAVSPVRATSTDPPGGVYWMALSRRFVTS